MNKIFQFTIFFILFILLYALLNSYVILRLGSMFSIKRVILYWVIALLTLSLPLITIIEKYIPNLATRMLYTVSALWIGLTFFFLCALAIYEIVRFIVGVPQLTAGIVILVIVGLVALYSIFNAFSVSVKEVDVPIDSLKKDVTIVQLSDIHIGTIRNSGFLSTVTKKINEINPDIVMITGDLVDGSAPLHSSMFNEFNSIQAPIYFVSGNHETYEGLDKVEKLLKETMIIPLHNKQTQFDGVQIIGVNFSEDRNYLKRELSKMTINKSKPAILMYHAPMSMEDAKAAGIDLQLSGHTHNGQIFPFNYIVALIFPKIRGLYNLDGMHLYVSPGTGTWGPYMRLGSKNEITVLRLQKN